MPASMEFRFLMTVRDDLEKQKLTKTIHHTNSVYCIACLKNEHFQRSVDIYVYNTISHTYV